MTSISLQNVSKRFRNHNHDSRWLRRDLIEFVCGVRSGDRWRTVLSDIDFDIEQGESVALLGINGGGKSTLLKLMAGVLQPTTGRIVRRGSVCTLLGIGTGFHDDLSGRENVFVNGAILGLSEEYLRIMMNEIERFAELEGHMDTPIKYYSSGMMARLGFAVAMSADPDIFLIDEILAVGDEGFQRRCIEKLHQLVSKGRTIVMASHDTSIVRQLCTRGIWLEGGTVRADGPIDEVCDEYSNHFYNTEVPLGA